MAGYLKADLEVGGTASSTAQATSFKMISAIFAAPLQATAFADICACVHPCAEHEKENAPPQTVTTNQIEIRELHALKPLVELIVDGQKLCHNQKTWAPQALASDASTQSNISKFGGLLKDLRDPIKVFAAAGALERLSYKNPEIQAQISTPIKAAIKGRIDEMTVDLLKNLLGCLGLKKAGKKAELVERLKAACSQVAVLFAWRLWGIEDGFAMP